MVVCYKEKHKKKLQILLPSPNTCHKLSSKFPGQYSQEERVMELQLKVCNFKNCSSCPYFNTSILINDACFICFQLQRVQRVSAISNRPTDAPDPFRYKQFELKTITMAVKHKNCVFLQVCTIYVKISRT